MILENTPETDTVQAFLLCGYQNSARLRVMKSFRLMLVLLLCMTVPVSGWASGLGGNIHSQHNQDHRATHSTNHRLEHSHSVALHGSASGHQHQHCEKESAQKSASKGDQCDCGCGKGFCASVSLSLLPVQPLDFSIRFVNASVHLKNDPAFAGTPASSPLRPPIS
ncbi:MAG: hypothetical protein ABIP02_02295 [Arenimonas sp.]